MAVNRDAYRRGFDAIDWRPLPPLSAKERGPVARASLPTPMIAGDTMDPVQSMADGKWYSSKAAIRASYRAENNPAGVTYTEVGNDPAWKRQDRPTPKADPEGIARAVEKAKARYDNGERPTV